MTTVATTSKAANFKPNPDIIVDIPCSLIKVDSKWNMRYDVASGDGEKDKGHLGVVESIACKGQNTPCTVRPNPEYPSKSSFPYELVAGFGRHKAISGTASGNYDEELRILVKDKVLPEDRFTALHVIDPTLRCVVKALTDEQARWENVEENVVRHQASGPDTAYAVAEISKFNVTQEVIAARLNMSQGHVSTMLRVHKAFSGLMLPKGAFYENSPKMAVLDHWRQHAARIPVKDLDAVGKLPTKEEQVATYLAMATTKVKNKTDSGLTQGHNAAVTNAINVHAPKMGAYLGNLARLKLVGCDVSLFSAAFIGDVLAPIYKPGAKVTDEEKQQMANAFRKAFDEALVKAPEPEIVPVAAAPAATDSAPLAAGMTEPGGKKKNKGATAAAS